MLDKRRRVYFKLNIMSILFTVVSMISVTLAWFAYSGLVDSNMEVGVRAWYIEFSKGDSSVSNDIVLSLDEIYPGMDTVTESITIKNQGDSDANLSYKITSARILQDDEFTSDNLASEVIEDKLSHDYPFSINVNISKSLLKSKDKDAEFEVSVNWPLDSGDDKLDSEWGTKAYKFEQDEKNKMLNNSGYTPKSAIKVVLSVSAQQAVKDDESLDTDYMLGKKILYDVEKDQICDEESSTCLNTHVIDTYNKIKDENVTLLVDFDSNILTTNYNDLKTSYSALTSSWKSNHSILDTSTLVKLISYDLKDSYIKKQDISNKIIGKVLFDERANSIINKVKQENNSFIFNTSNYLYLSTHDCIWTKDNYDDTRAFALSYSKIYPENKSTTCKVIPVIKANKNKLKTVL